MLSGGASRVDGFHEMVQERFNAPVEDFDPFRAIAWDTKKLGGEAIDHAATAAVAVGLALRKVGDR
jgi:Tfp pilus assembly PilM family ATPase